jgi:hypothetical protein
VGAVVPPEFSDGSHLPEHHATRTIDIAVALLLGLAALTSGLTTWRSAIHAGEAQSRFTLSTQAVNNANALQQNAEAAATSERTLYVAYVGALAKENTAGAEAIWGLMNLTTKETISWWRAQPASSRPASPFSAANPAWTTPRRIIEARVTLRQSAGRLAEADSQLNQSHTLELIVALLSITFLTGGLAATISTETARRVLFSVASLFLIVGVVGLIALW